MEKKSEVQRLQQRLADMKVTNFGFTRGEKDCTPEELAAELNRVLDCIERGECEEIFDLEYGLKFESREQCREFYNIYPIPTWSTSDPVSRDTYLTRCDEYEASLEDNFKKFMDERCNKKT